MHTVAILKYGNLVDDTALVVAQITHSPFAIAINVHGTFAKQSQIFQPRFIPLSQLASGGPLAAKRTIHDSHTWSGGDLLRQHNLPQMVRGDQLWPGTNCGVTVHNEIDKLMFGLLYAGYLSERLQNTSFFFIDTAFFFIRVSYLLSDTQTNNLLKQLLRKLACILF